MEKDPGLHDIDRYNLDEEGVVQERFMRKYTRLVADADAAFERAKDNKDLVASEVAMRVRRNPLNYGIDGRVTDKKIEEAVTCNKKYRQAFEAYVLAKHHLEVCKGFVRALDHRKSMIELEDRLDSRGYFARPRQTPQSEEKSAGNTFRRVSKVTRKGDE